MEIGHHPLCSLVPPSQSPSPPLRAPRSGPSSSEGSDGSSQGRKEDGAGSGEKLSSSALLLGLRSEGVPPPHRTHCPTSTAPRQKAKFLRGTQFNAEHLTFLSFSQTHDGPHAPVYLGHLNLLSPVSAPSPMLWGAHALRG